MTYTIFDKNAYVQECPATVIAVTEQVIILDKTVFYPLSGGQAGDSGHLELADGSSIAIADTRKEKNGEGAFTGRIVHIPLTGAGPLRPGDSVRACIDWARRYQIMRFHSATHLLCKLLPFPVNGCSISADGARMDFVTAEALDIDALNASLARLIHTGHPVRVRTMTGMELQQDPALAASMSVHPPQGLAEIRTVRVGGDELVDLQPCCGTHVAATSEIGAILISKIEKKSGTTRRIVLRQG